MLSVRRKEKGNDMWYFDKTDKTYETYEEVERIYSEMGLDIDYIMDHVWEEE